MSNLFKFHDYHPVDYLTLILKLISMSIVEKLQINIIQTPDVILILNPTSNFHVFHVPNGTEVTQGLELSPSAADAVLDDDGGRVQSLDLEELDVAAVAVASRPRGRGRGEPLHGELLVHD